MLFYFLLYKNIANKMTYIILLVILKKYFLQKKFFNKKFF